ncbi:cytochrome C peroxidase [Flavobacteriaceae bacterium W22]|nr:cytochrome C peroxidase [Flavobacteriaceae bacterium W22]
MIKKIVLLFLLISLIGLFSFRKKAETSYEILYNTNISHLVEEQEKLVQLIKSKNSIDSFSSEDINDEIKQCRKRMKTVDFWIRYFDPVNYKMINGPLPVEWETEVFEKFEKPYRRDGAGFTLAQLYLEEENINKDSLELLIQKSLTATKMYQFAEIKDNLKNPETFYFCNRLFLLNLATIYTTGFECPETENVITEMHDMLSQVKTIYEAYNESFPKTSISESYLELYKKTIKFVENQHKDYTKFNHFVFVRDYINPLFALNQQQIVQYGFYSKNNLDFTLSNDVKSIFDKNLFFAQNIKGEFSFVKDSGTLRQIDSLGKLLFYDPILSGNNERSCVSCHKSENFFTDNSVTTALQYNGKNLLERNAPSLVNAPYNHLMMLDGKFLDLKQQGEAVITNPIEMGSTKKEVLEKVLSCPDYKKNFKNILKKLPDHPKEVKFDHIISALTTYFGKYSQYYSKFDRAMKKNEILSEDEISGYNLYMGKAQCATCHFAPTFSGIKPPYIGNEFEVIGVPADKNYRSLSNDKGRYYAHPAKETLHAFRTTTLRNVEKTKPYMHNGAFDTLEEVIDFYNAGGGVGKKLNIPNQTLSSDSLKLSKKETNQLISFLKSLTEEVIFDKPPKSLPKSKRKEFNARKVGGSY